MGELTNRCRLCYSRIWLFATYNSLRGIVFKRESYKISTVDIVFAWFTASACKIRMASPVHYKRVARGR